MWSHQDTDEMQRLKSQLTTLQDSGVVFPEDSWPTRLLRSHPRWLKCVMQVTASTALKTGIECTKDPAQVSSHS